MARRLVAAVAAAVLVAGWCPRALAEAAEGLLTARDAGALEVAGDAGGGGLEVVGAAEDSGDAAGDAVAASAQDVIEGNFSFGGIQIGAYTFYSDSGALIVTGYVVGGSAFRDVFDKVPQKDVKSVVFERATLMLYGNDMFVGCYALTTVDASGLNVSQASSMERMFQGCSSLTSLEGISAWDTRSVTSMRQMFQGCSSLTSLDGFTDWKTLNVTDMSYMFEGCSSLTSLEDIYKWNTSKVTDMSSMFDDCTQLTTLDGLSDPDNWDTSKVTNMSKMFYGCSLLTSLEGISEWNTGSVTNMSGMFQGCSSLTSLDGIYEWNTGISKWNTGSVTNMSGMFQGCSSLTSLEDISEWNTASVTNMSGMFQGCSSLTSPEDISAWDTSHVEDMSSMFDHCSRITSIDLSGWETSSVTNMRSMFGNCNSLASLDLSGWETGEVTDMSHMFQGCSSLEAVWAGPGWSTGNVAVSEDMFVGCTRLKGGAGTAYDAGQTDKTYAHVDGGTGDPGYLTEGPVFRGCYLVLSGDIGETFTLAAPPSFDAEGARVGFRVGGRKVADAPLSDFETDGGGRYLLRCGTTSLEMAEDVVVTLRWGEGASESVSASYSVEDYARYVDAHVADYGEEAARLARAINDYGYYVQKWLSGVYGFTLGEGGYAAMRAAYTGEYNHATIKERAERDFKISKNLGSSGVKVSYQLHLDSATGLSVRVRPEPVSVGIVRDSLRGTLQDGGGRVAVSGPLTGQEYYVVRLDGIPAHRLADWFRVSGRTGRGEFSVDVCALSYVRTVYWTSENAENTAENTAAKDAMAALLEYYDAAVDYKKVTA